MTSHLNIATRIPCTSVEGPGFRYALWVQGCDIGCIGCCNQELLPFVRRQIISSSEIVLEIERARELHGIEGVTFLGGEPTYQAKGLAEIAASCQLQGLSVMLFTGFQLGQLRQRNLPGVEFKPRKVMNCKRIVHSLLPYSFSIIRTEIYDCSLAFP